MIAAVARVGLSMIRDLQEYRHNQSTVCTCKGSTFTLLMSWPADPIMRWLHTLKEPGHES